MSADYQLTQDADVVVRETDGKRISATANNQAWQRYQAWLYAGNTPDPAPQVPPPTTISAAEFLTRFTDAERAAVWQACLANMPLGVGLITGVANGFVDLTGATIQVWMQGLVAASALTADRSTAILTP